MTTNNISTYTLDNSLTIDTKDLFYNHANDTMYYTTSTGVINTIDISSSNYTTIDSRTWDTYSSWFKNLKEFEDTMPDLTKIKEMCIMYPAMAKAFENFKAVYDLIKDDYEARKNNDS